MGSAEIAGLYIAGPDNDGLIVTHLPYHLYAGASFIQESRINCIISSPAVSNPANSSVTL